MDIRGKKLVVIGGAGLIGSEGMAVFDDTQPWENKVVHYAHRIEIQDGIPVPAKADPINVELVEDEPLKLECQHFIDCATTGETPRTDGYEGLRVLKVLQAAQDALDAERAK
jgi:UDP-2-acetamido-3-amino-2,3-dideoxy-glucuronate N-acetyltransferase